MKIMGTHLAPLEPYATKSAAFQYTRAAVWRSFCSAKCIVAIDGMSHIPDNFFALFVRNTVVNSYLSSAMFAINTKPQKKNRSSQTKKNITYDKEVTGVSETSSCISYCDILTCLIVITQSHAQLSWWLVEIIKCAMAGWHALVGWYISILVGIIRWLVDWCTMAGWHALIGWYIVSACIHEIVHS